jgi:uncharacterized membrane protein (UPF0182 family)
MTPGRRLLFGLAAAAAVLLLGRILAVVYADYTWYNALDASALWSERARDVAVIHVLSATIAGVFALVNLFAIRRSIVSLAFPRRLGNVEFGEEVPARYLDRGVLALSIAVGALAAIVVPKWEHLALIRTGVRYGEKDPFFQMDLSFYVAWLPLEFSAYTWALTVLVSVSAVVVGLYALTPSLRWERGAFRLSVHVRRHLAVLGALFLLVTAWNYRLAGYRLLINGTGVDGMFSYLDHQWLIPAYLSLSVVTVAAAALVFVSGWTGQLRTIFFTISAVLVFSIALDLVLPSVARRFAVSSLDTRQQQPYAATRAAFSRRAYGEGRGSPTPAEVTRFAAFGDSARIAKLVEDEKARTLVYPGAHSAAVVSPAAAIPAPALGSGLSRLAHGWAEQRLDLVWGAFPPTARIVRIRDVRDRVRALAPVFAQGSTLSPAFLGDTVMWVVELYSASATYPLSAHYTLAGSDRSYFRHAGTALINSRTGRVSIVSSATPDPIAAAWRARFPATFRAGGADILDALTVNPVSSVADSAQQSAPSASDKVFRAEVTRLYLRMRQALASGNLSAFAAAYDSLGALIGRE